MSKPSATSAASTAFCAQRIDGPGGLHLWIDGNGKITAANGTLEHPKPNAFSLLHIKDCPGSTPTCRASCYVHGLEKHAPETYDLYGHNSKTIRKILANTELALEWATHMGRWISKNCDGGFRWHVSGDVFSVEYANWLAVVTHISPDVRHWIYTRSFDLIEPLVERSTKAGGNLAVNLSADDSNWREALVAEKRYKNKVRICYMATAGGVPPIYMQEGDVIFPDYALRGGTPEGMEWFKGLEPAERKMVCPVDYHGKSEVRRCGPCDRCMK